MKKNILNWLDKVSLLTLTIVALLLALAPVLPVPHLYEKLRMLFTGELRQTIDIFDLLLHGTPIIVLTIKLGKMSLSWLKHHPKKS